MGAGHLLASYDDTTVVTVLGGRPPAYPDEPTEWDALGGFVAGDDVVAVRREEDVAAMAVLESGYPGSSSPTTSTSAPPSAPRRTSVAPVLGATIAELDPTAVFFPMGLGNPDHVMVHDACLGCARSSPIGSGSATRTTATSTSRACWPGGWPSCCARSPWPTPAIVPHVPDEERKRRAIWCYTSQIAPLEHDHALSARMEGRVPEQFWRLAPPPAGVGGAGRPRLTPARDDPPGGSTGGPRRDPTDR